MIILPILVNVYLKLSSAGQLSALILKPLFYDGLGLDSIDSLELSMALSSQYGFQLKSDDPNNKEIFSSIRSLAKYVKLNFLYLA
jgi:acyl carrier protein